MTQSLKNLHRRKGGDCLGRYTKIYGALGTLYAKQTFNRIAANGCLEPKSTDAAASSNGRDEHGADVLGCDHSPCRLLKRVKYTHAYAT